MRSGVEAPEADEGVLGVGGARLLEDALRESRVGVGDLTSPVVVLRVMFVVSAEGGAGMWWRLEGERICARLRKHSPVPKLWGDGCGASVR